MIGHHKPSRRGAFGRRFNPSWNVLTSYDSKLDNQTMNTEDKEYIKRILFSYI